MTLSAGMLSAISAQSTGEIPVHLLELSHADIPVGLDPYRFASDNKDDLPVAGVPGFIHAGNEYIFVPFEITLPQDDEKVKPVVQLTISNVAREIIDTLRTLTGDIVVDYKMVLSSEPDTVQMALPSFVLRNVSYDQMKVTGSLELEDYSREPYGFTYNPADFPGIHA